MARSPLTPMLGTAILKRLNGSNSLIARRAKVDAVATAVHDEGQPTERPKEKEQKDDGGDRMVDIVVVSLHTHLK